MLYYLAELAKPIGTWWPGFSPFNVFRYITFRALLAAITALVICWILGPRMIRILTALKMGQPIRSASEVRQLHDLHGKKKGTPTMGGSLILMSVLFSSLLWAIPANLYVWLALVTMLVLGGVGFWDDYQKVVKRNSKGISAGAKILAQLGIALFVGFGLLWDAGAVQRELFVPFYKNAIVLNMSWVLIPYCWLVLSGTSNAVNLTDGLDGLAIGCTISVSAVYMIIAYLVGNQVYAHYLHLGYAPQASELTVICAAMLGASLGFLWYNCHPAQVFMGDTGSLPIGGMLGVVALCTKQELLLVLVGAIFVIEAASVILQVASFKLTGKRIFAMSPLHHHFELRGWTETTVVVRFWILSFLFAILGLISLKLR
ncbi:MAG: phospho-N-acetylmuramoyl-pentapeptide-transferase [Verrucomicrobiae bacterium]|nr:phospho-N-acetylmuramoyl-pentapeptide-transferase [Verrucomicrobiae bacterium]